MIWIPFRRCLWLVKCFGLSSLGWCALVMPDIFWEPFDEQGRLCGHAVDKRLHADPENLSCYVCHNFVLSQPHSIHINCRDFVINIFNGACHAPVPVKVIVIVRWTWERVVVGWQWLTVAYLPHISRSLLQMKWPQAGCLADSQAVCRRGAICIRKNFFWG